MFGGGGDMTSDRIEVLRCPKCSRHDVTGRGGMNAAGEWEMTYRCDGRRGCGHQFDVLEVEADDGSLQARRLRKRPWLRRLWGQR